MITLDEVMSVYSGKPGCCCCGCNGKHTYKKETRELASKNRGYEVKDNEINDRTVKMIINKMNAQFAKVEKQTNHYFLDLGNRWYIAYTLS